MPSSRTVSPLFRLPSSCRFGDRQQPSSSTYSSEPSPLPAESFRASRRAAFRLQAHLVFYMDSFWIRLFGLQATNGHCPCEKLTENLYSVLWNGTWKHLYRPLSYTHIKKETRAHTSLTVIHRNALYRGRKRESQRTFMMKAACTSSLEQAPGRGMNYKRTRDPTHSTEMLE